MEQQRELRFQHRRDQVTREDLTLFINACFACTGQREFYSAPSQQVSIPFLHAYIQGNYRVLYARTLAAGINQFNQAEIVLNLLATGQHTPANFRSEENALITATLQALPTQRAWRLIEQIRQRRINNRRTRALVRDFVARRRDLAFEAVKYRSKVRAAAVHAHLPLPTMGNVGKELGRFLFHGGVNGGAFATPLFESFRQAHYTTEAIYHLPLTVAEGFAAKHGIDRDSFLRRIAAQTTVGERLRLQNTYEQEGVTNAPAIDPTRLSLTRLALYALSLPHAVRDTVALTDSLHKAAHACLRNTGSRIALTGLGRVAAVLDNSYSSSGSEEKRRRPLAIAFAVHFLLEAARGNEGTYHGFWTLPPPNDDPLLIAARGQSDLATPLLDALDWGADTILIVSDGQENDPPQGAAEVIRVIRTKLGPAHRTAILHLNPVFRPEDLSPKSLSPFVPTVGLRDAEDLPTALGFARFAEGTATLAELEAYLALRRDRFLQENALA